MATSTTSTVDIDKESKVLKHRLELARINIYCLRQKLQLEEVQHAAHIDDVVAQKKRYVDAGHKAVLSSFDREKTSAERSMAGRRQRIGFQVEREELRVWLCVQEIESLKMQKKISSRSLSMS